MEIEIKAVGGYEEVGANLTALRIDDTVILIDMGLMVDKLTSLGEREDINSAPLSRLYELGAIPDDRVIENWRSKVKGIFISHAHLDHVGAAPFLAGRYSAPVYATPYTVRILKSLCEDAGIVLPNDIKQIPPNSRVKINDKIEVEMLHITHSIPQTAMIVVHTPEGAIVYAADFKFDNFPTIGKRPDYNRLKEIGKEGVIALITETTRADEESKSSSEVIAKYMLYDVLSSVEDEGLIVTTFASHIARLKSLVEIAGELDREVVFLGRSFGKYLPAAEELGFYNFSEVAQIYSNARDYPRVLKQVAKEKSKYMLIVTGHQGEPGSVLDRMAKDQLPWDFEGNTVVFANTVIPYPTNQANRQLLEERLKKRGAHLIKDVHVSGHAKAEDHRMLIRMLKPQYIFPMHGTIIKRAAYINIASEFGYELGEDIFLLQNSHSKVLKL